MRYFAVLIAAGLATPAMAQAQEEPKPKPEVVETDDKGQPTRVRIGETLYYLCNEERQDSCINPRDAGFDFGNRELTYWPGKPASEIDAPLPPTREQAVAQGLIEEDQPTVSETPPAE